MPYEGIPPHCFSDGSRDAYPRVDIFFEKIALKPKSRGLVVVRVANNMDRELAFTPVLELEIKGEIAQVLVKEPCRLGAGSQLELVYDLVVDRESLAGAVIRIVLTNDVNLEAEAEVSGGS